MSSLSFCKEPILFYKSDTPTANYPNSGPEKRFRLCVLWLKKSLKHYIVWKCPPEKVEGELTLNQ